MTIVEQRAAESIASTLPRILKELKRANNLKALSIQMGIDKAKRESKSEKDNNDIFIFERQLEAIMEGI